MKNVIKLIGITALVAAIGFSMAACASGGDPAGNTETALEFKGYTGNADDVTIIISWTAPRAAITPRSGDYYVIQVNKADKSSGRITISGNNVTFTPNTGAAFTGNIENFDQNLTVNNIPDVGKVFLAAVGKGKTVTITDLKGMTSGAGSIVRVGAWLFEELPESGKPLVNTAIQSWGYDESGATRVFNLIVPRDNTWTSTTDGKPQPRWDGTGSYYVGIFPVVQMNNTNSYDWGSAMIYSNGTNSPVKVSFDTANVTLDFSEFIPLQ